MEAGDTQPKLILDGKTAGLYSESLEVYSRQIERPLYHSPCDIRNPQIQNCCFAFDDGPRRNA